MINQKVLSISVIVPFKDHADMTITCLESVVNYANDVSEILLVSNNSTRDELTKVKQAARAYKNAKVLEYNHPFNFQKINNWAVEQSKGKVCFFLNNDVELTAESTTLIEAMYNKSLTPNVGAVGAVLLYEDAKTIQHAGIYLVPQGTADHLYIGQSLSKVKQAIDSGKYIHNILDDFEVSAVTAAAVMVSRDNFNLIKGFNEAFIICGGDVDLCLRLNRQGKKSILIGSNAGFMLHKESRSRSSIGIPYVDFTESYKSYIENFDICVGDPFLNWKDIKDEQ